MYDPSNLRGVNPSFFVIWGLSPPSPYVEPPLPLGTPTKTLPQRVASVDLIISCIDASAERGASSKLYRVIQRLIQHCLLSKMVYLNLKYVTANRSYYVFIHTQNLFGNITLSRVIISVASVN